MEGGFSPSLLSFQCLWLTWSPPMTQLLPLAGLVLANLGPAGSTGGREEPGGMLRSEYGMEIPGVV